MCFQLMKLVRLMLFACTDRHIVGLEEHNLQESIPQAIVSQFPKHVRNCIEVFS